MLDIVFYKFNKNENSTKKVNVSGDTFKCLLIEPTDIISPNVSLIHKNPVGYNYAHIPAFNRYYFVNNWAYSGGRWTAALNVDVLASFKSEIGASRQYVVRSAHSFDGNIIDTLYPTKNNPICKLEQCQTASGEAPFISELERGKFVVGIVNKAQNAVGVVSYYEFSSAQFRAFCNVLMGSSDWFYGGIDEIGEELAKVIFNPFQYVVSCMWFPIEDLSIKDYGPVSYGWWDLTVQAATISGGAWLVSANFAVPKHPQHNSRGAYLNGAPFSRYTLAWPCFGMFPLDADTMGLANRISAQCFVDPISGLGTLNVFDPDGNAVYLSMQTQIGVPIQLAQMAVDYLGVASSTVQSINSLANLDMGGFFESIGDAISSAMPQLSTSGRNGGISSYIFDPTLHGTFYLQTDDDIIHRGRPLMQDVVLSTIPGYILCSDAELECSCTSNELQSIKSYLNGGFYYE